MDLTLIVVLVIALALFFDFTNGFHDTANAMATPIATGAMRPKVAVAVAAVLNLVGAFLSTAVATTISSGLINESDGSVQITPEMIFAGLVGAIVWNMVTWLFGLPSSSSHALFGGLIGAAIVGAGFQAVNYWTLLDKIIIPAVLAPLIAGLVAFVATKLAYSITRRYDSLPDGRAGFRYGQIFSSSLVALSHGTNDAQKTMGVITLVLISGGFLERSGDDPVPVPFWVITACAFAIAAGTYTGGWRIIATLGKGLTEIKPAQGFSAEVSTGAAILASTHLGFALSTTQVASGSVIGSGLGRRGSKVRWKTARRIGLGWLMTLPAAAVVGGITAWIAHLGPVGVVVDAVVGVIVIAGIFALSKRRQIAEKNAASGVGGPSDVSHAGRVVKIKKPKPKKSKKAKRGKSGKTQGQSQGKGKKKKKHSGKGSKNKHSKSKKGGGKS